MHAVRRLDPDARRPFWRKHFAQCAGEWLLLDMGVVEDAGAQHLPLDIDHPI